jgi:DNA-binding transcriptional LysR family regulator
MRVAVLKGRNALTKANKWMIGGARPRLSGFAGPDLTLEIQLSATRELVMDRLTHMTTFVKVVQAGGFAAAGRRLGISPSTTTMHIQALEERLGVRLLNRSTRKVSLTEIGKSYYERCLRIIADSDDADNIVQTLHATPRGTLRLNVSVPIPVLLAPVIAEFTSLYPEVKLIVTMTDRIVDLVGERIDLAISTLPIPDSNLIIKRVGSLRRLVCGAPSYLAKHGVPYEPRDLMSHNCLRYSFCALGSDWPFDGLEGQQTVHISGNMESNSINALVLAAVRGQGLILIPDFLVMDEITSGELVPVLTEFCCPERPINAVFPHRHHRSANVRSFLELVTKRVSAVDGVQHCKPEFPASLTPAKRDPISPA